MAVGNDVASETIISFSRKKHQNIKDFHRQLSTGALDFGSAEHGRLFALTLKFSELGLSENRVYSQ